MKDYDRFSSNVRWFERVMLKKNVSLTMGTFITVTFIDDVSTQPSQVIRLNKKQADLIRSSRTTATAQRKVDNSRALVYSLFYLDQSITLVPHQLEQDTEPIGFDQKRSTCYSLVLDIIAKAMEKVYGK